MFLRAMVSPSGEGYVGMQFNRAGWRVSSEMSYRSGRPLQPLLDGLADPFGDRLPGFPSRPLDTRAERFRDLRFDLRCGNTSSTERHASSRSHTNNVLTKFPEGNIVRTNKRFFSFVMTELGVIWPNLDG